MGVAHRMELHHRMISQDEQKANTLVAPSPLYKADNSNPEGKNGHQPGNCSQYTTRNLEGFAPIGPQPSDTADYTRSNRKQQPHPPREIARTKGHGSVIVAACHHAASRFL